MRAGLVTAWLFGMGLITWRSITKEHHPPIPGQLLGASGFFALLALLAEYQPAAGAAAALGWGVDLAALLYQPGNYPNYTGSPLIASLFGGTTDSKKAGPKTPGAAAGG